MARELVELESWPNMGFLELLLLSVFLLGILVGHCLTKCLSKEPVSKPKVDSKFAKGKQEAESRKGDSRERNFVIFPSSGERYHRTDCKFVLEARRKQTRLVSPCVVCDPLK